LGRLREAADVDERVADPRRRPDALEISACRLGDLGRLRQELEAVGVLEPEVGETAEAHVRERELRRGPVLLEHRARPLELLDRAGGAALLPVTASEVEPVAGGVEGLACKVEPGNA